MLAFRRFQSGEVRTSPFLYLGGCFARALPVRCSTLSYEGHEARNWKHWATLQSNL